MSVAEVDVLERLRDDTPLYAERFLKIVDKRDRLIPFRMNAAQLALDAMLREQRDAGLPERVVVLKARRVGISTYAQARLIQGATLRGHYSGVCLAHDRETGAVFYRMGDRMYRNLPNEPELKPPIRHHQRARFLHFGAEEMDGTLWPDSSYLVDTAGETHAGHGGGNTEVHASEVARWPNAIEKFTALKITVPREVNTLFLIESTAYGYNLFKDLCDDAIAGLSEYRFFFWPWWLQEDYTLPFANEAERESFKPGEGPYGEREPELLDPGPTDFLTGQTVPLTLEQLNWRRMTIANECSGKLDTFDEQYPTVPEDAFRASGRKVFDPNHVRKLIAECATTDPRVPSEEHPGPTKAKLCHKRTVTRVGRVGPNEVPAEPYFKERRELGMTEVADWKLWLPEPDPSTGYVIGVDVSGGFPESDQGTDPAMHAIEVIDHKTGAQVAEYTSRCDSALLAVECYLAARYWNDAWLAIETTGGWGVPVFNTIWRDYRYMWLYFRRRKHSASDRQEDRIGWDTNRETKPVLLSEGAELLREGTHGIKSVELAREFQTYTKTDRGKTLPEPGKFADRLMAWLIAQQVRREEAIRPKAKRARSIANAYGT